MHHDHNHDSNNTNDNKKKHKNRASIDSAHSAVSRDSHATTSEHHDNEGDEEDKLHGLWHKIEAGMEKARPYMERLSGTYEPLPIKQTEHHPE